MPPHQYENYRSPFANNIAELLQEPGRIRAQQALTTGNANAQAVQASGQAWGNAISNIGQSVAAIPAQMQQQKLLDARIAETEAQAVQRKTEAQKGLDLKAQNAFIDRTMQGAMKTDETTGIRTFDRSTFEKSLVDGGMGHLYPSLSETLDKLDASAAKRTAEGRSLYAHSLVGIEQAGYTPQSLLSAAAFLKANGAITDQQLKPLQDALAKDASPESIQKLVAGMGQSLPEYQALKTAEETRKAALAKTTAETSKLTAEATGTVPMTPAQTAANLVAQQTRTDVAAGQAETHRHNLAGEALDRQKAAQAQGDKTELTPAGLDAAAMMFAKTGQLPALGMGDKTTRKAIINRAAVMVPGLDVATAKADFGANSASLTGLQKQRDALGAFEATALKNLGVFISLAEKVPDSGSPALNQPLRYVNERMFGGDTLTAYNTARRTVIPEFAKILANPGLSGQLSDTARKEIEDVVSGAATLKQTLAAAKVLKQDTENRRTSYDDQITAISARIKLGSATSSTATAEKPSAAAPTRIRYDMNGKPIA